MKAYTMICVIFIAGWAVSMFPPPAHAVQTLFYDSFSSSYLTSSWSNVQSDLLAPSTTSVFTNGGGSLTLQSLRAGIGSQGGIIANGTGPILSAGTVDGQLVDVIYSIKPFNLTLAGQTSIVSSMLQFGLADRITPYSATFGPNDGIWWNLAYSTNGKTIGASITVSVQKPGVSSTSAACYGTTYLNYCRFGPISYGPLNPSLFQSTPIDLTQAHIFQIVIHRLAAQSATWAAFSVDSGMVLNVTQAACGCLGDTGQFRSLYPFVYQGYGWNSLPQSSQGAVISYILVTDYIPPNPALGFYPSPNPCTGQGGAVSTPINPNGCHGSPGPETDLSTLFQQEAVIVGGGNVYFGGAFITLMVMGVFIIPIALLITRNIFIHSFITIFIVGLMTYVSILPIYVIIVDIILGAATIYGVVRGQIGGGGDMEVTSL